ncbi:hypothetical protein MPTK1_6g15990 [Marchantia polymorpha subsp. ruderalis]|uniref:Chromatin modification-related protein EAF7 n=2 Tax=Marchantia polymorpha TaxID=3197 RepID=A0AAF6BSJ6_MARPO|nr:hypothetical protein MARPO_0056s0111 [Marchantia polymorpha]BBN14980.1 hypothetical protein Mp_6g15990 [Marchantia polymorpha subsp. ruderalis]|eukprot:PTQ37664.1 hypothetical protein MARPO_0056s0111 [Marchantia polymorpha]
MADEATAMEEQQEEDEEDDEEAEAEAQGGGGGGGGADGDEDDGVEEEEEEEEEDEEEDGDDDDDDDGEEEEEGEAEDDEELKKDVTPTPTPPSLVEEEQQQQQPADFACPISSTPPAPSSATGPPAAVCKELQQVEVELRLLEALEIYHPSKLLGMHRHFILYGLMEYLERRLNHHYTAEEILELLDRFYNLELLKPDEEELELLSQEEEFALPASILAVKEEPRGSS